MSSDQIGSLAVIVRFIYGLYLKNLFEAVYLISEIYLVKISEMVTPLFIKIKVCQGLHIQLKWWNSERSQQCFCCNKQSHGENHGCDKNSDLAQVTRPHTQAYILSDSMNMLKKIHVASLRY